MRKRYYIVTDALGSQWISHGKTGTRRKTSVDLTDKYPPRLFSTRVAALLAIQWWKGGRWYTDYGGDLNVKRDPERADTLLLIRPITIQTGGHS